MLPGAFTGNADCDAGISGFCHVLVTPSLVAQEVKRLSVMWETWSGRSAGEGHGSPLQYSCLENSMDGGTW